MVGSLFIFRFFFFNDTATTEIYTLSLHDALPILPELGPRLFHGTLRLGRERRSNVERSEEHTSELQSPCNLVCRLLLEKKKKRLPHLIRSGTSKTRFPFFGSRLTPRTHYTRAIVP